MLRSEIMEYYRQGGERHRLAAGQGRLEYLRTRTSCPGSCRPARLRAGRWRCDRVYARPLAQLGYAVTVVDRCRTTSPRPATCPASRRWSATPGRFRRGRHGRCRAAAGAAVPLQERRSRHGVAGSGQSGAARWVVVVPRSAALRRCSTASSRTTSAIRGFFRWWSVPWPTESTATRHQSRLVHQRVLPPPGRDQ